jgi:hypothetical protein
MTKLLQFVKDTPSRIEIAQKLAKQISDSKASDRLADQKWTRIQSSLLELRELTKLIQSGLPERLAEKQRILPLIAMYQQVTVGFDELQMQTHLLNAADQTVFEFVASATQDSETTTMYLNDARSAFAEFNALRDESVSLGQRLREIAGKILEKAADPDQCPLCHTRFGPGELTSHMHEGVDQLLEEKAATHLNTIGDREKDAIVATGKRSAAQWAEIACHRLEQPISIKVSALMSQVSSSQKECSELLLTQTRLDQEIGQLQKSGFSAERYRQLVTKLSATYQTISIERIKAETEKLESVAAHKLVERDGYAQSIQEALATAEKAIPITNDVSLETAISQLKEKLVSDESLLAKLEPFSLRFSWPEFQPFSELALSVATVRQLAGDYQVTYSKEQNSVKVLATASARKEQIQRQLDGLLPKIERFSEAKEVLSQIINEHSLPGAMEEALRQNRVAIEGIFSRIHSPAEFSGLGDTLTTLVRKNGGGTASLQQISAGQRAAFALSLFLAQNAQLRSAPPLILIDDPIAHVDDLNCLSFLDYLREVVVSSDRQVVFATANDKVAMLFERKFDFLGNDDFRRYDLTR